MPSLKLSNLFRRGTDHPSLKERAAGLRASVNAHRRSSTPLPALGSEEAKAAWRTACHDHTIRTQFANEYPELKRTPLEWWTADSLSKALETGELTPAECARLYPLATERELRMAEIEHELNLGGLFALAFANEYPVKVEDPAADEVQTAAPRSLVDQIDLTAATLDDLVALYDTANLIADMAHAMCWQGRCHARGWNERANPGDQYNVAGDLMQWLGDEMTEVVSATVQEATQRVPSTETDREARLMLMARGVIEDGDHERTAAFARELSDHAEAEKAGRC